MPASELSNHPHQQKLMQYAEKTLNAEEAQSIADHLQNCDICRNKLNPLNVKLGNSENTTLSATKSTVQPLTLAPTLPPALPQQDLAATLLHAATKEASSPPSSTSSAVDLDTLVPPPTAMFTENASNKASDSVGGSIGPYQLEAKLGEGGMGAVYKARHTKLDKIVALKVLPQQFTQNTQFIARFEREMRAVGKLDHPQIVRAMDAGEIHGIHYLAMEYVDGTDLQALVRARGPLSVVNSCKAIRQAAQALAAAHAAGLVHRDIKPANLLLAKNGQMKVLDLGLALLGDEAGHHTELTTAGQTFGTPDYMAPEQWDNAHGSDGRVDLYALGCTLFFLLTGRAPYATENCNTTVAKMKAHVLEPIPDLKSACKKDIPAAVVAVYQKLMAKAPEDRFQSATELVAALSPLVTGKTTTDKPTQKSEASTTPAATAQPTSIDDSSNSVSDAIAGLPPVPHMTGPISDSLLINTEAISKLPIQPQLRSAGNGKGKIPTGAIIACGGTIVALLLGAIVITIRNREGSDTIVNVPDQPVIEHKIDPGSQAPLTQQNSNTIPTPTSDSVERIDAPSSLSVDASQLTPKEYSEELSLAKWVLAQGGSGKVRLASGSISDLKSAVESPLQQFACIEIVLSGTPVIDEDLRRFSNCKQLQSLLLSGARINGTGLKYLKPITTLASLTLEGQVDSNGKSTLLQDEGLAGLSDLPQLTHLNLSNNSSLTDVCLDHVSKLLQLRGLKTTGMNITDSGLEKLDPLEKLDEYFEFLNLPFVTDQGVRRFFEKHPSLKSTGIANFIHSEMRTIQPLEKATALENVFLSSNQLTSDSLRVLSAIPNLSEIALNAPTDESVITLLQLNNLKRLSLYRYIVGDTKLSDDIYSRIAKHPSIEYLHDAGSDNSPTDERLMMLAQCPSLKTLSLHFHNNHEPRRYTDAGIAKLRQVRPDLNLDIDGKSFPGDPNSKPLIERAKAEPMPSSIVESGTKVSPKVERLKITGTPKPPGPSVKQLSLLNKAETNLKFKPGTPISSRALIGAPSGIKELVSWSIEPRSHYNHTGGMAMHPDGSQFATVGMRDSSIRIWERNPSDPKKVVLKKVILGEAFSIFDSAWSHSGEYLAVACNSGRAISIYEPNSGRLVTQVPLKHGVLQLAWSPNDRFLLAASGYTLFLVDLASGKVATPEKEGNYSRAEWSPDGLQFVTIERNGNVKFWNAATMETLSDVPQPTYVQASAVAWSPDGRTVVVGNRAGNVAIWDPVLRKVNREVSLTAGNAIECLCWEPLQNDGKPFTEHGSRLLVSSNPVKIYDSMLTNQLASWSLNSGSGGVVWSPSAETVVFSVNDRPVVFDSITGELLAEPEYKTPISNGSNNLSTDGKILRFIDGMDLLLFDADSGDFIKRLANIPGVECLAAPKDDWLACFDLKCQDHQLCLVDTATYEKRVPLNEHIGPIRTVNWSPTGQLLASGGTDKAVKIWKPGKKESVLTILHPRAVNNVIWSPDGRQLATCTDDSIIRLWNADSGALDREYPRLPSPPEPGPAGIAWSPNADVIAIAPLSALAVTLDLRTGKISEPFLETSSALTSVSWSPDGKQIAVANGNYGTELGIRPIAGNSLPVVHGHGTPIQWLPDSRRLLTGLQGNSLIQAVDVRRGNRLGVLIPKTASGGWICLGADGHFRGSDGIESEFVYVALHKDGSQTIHSPAEFQHLYGWTNDPSKVTFLKLRDRAAAGRPKD